MAGQTTGQDTGSGAVAPRRAALHLLDQVLGERRLLAELIALPDGPLAAMQPSARARAQRLALTALRNIGRADRLLGPHLRKRPPLPVHNILRLALAEVLAEGEAAHGVVNSAVTIARSSPGTAAMAGLVNAVLRRCLEGAEGRWNELPVQELPKWLRRPLIDAYGKPAVQGMERAHLAGAPLDLTLKQEDHALTQALGAATLPGGSLRLPARVQVSDLPGYTGPDAGWWVQDAAAALPVRLLDPRPGERIADLCAAPGGKTMQLAAAGATVTAVDLSAQRMERVRENLRRTGLEADLVVADATQWRPAAPLDAVVLDAPCSATGTIRRHPDLPFVKDGSEISALVALQARLLDHAVGLLRDGGRLVFCTCSLLPEEGEAQALAALKRHPGLQILPACADWIDPQWRSPEGGLRLRPDFWPDRGGMDGFYMVVMQWTPEAS
ncbi:RsmB/NOP family class I SAM-dependent RNA methyltransferase [Plastorhodobacter daqingensis]|uniref:RsmB/NOP family class I SAM-dependent RNA methyltransferase n=1 Tax=Plastorhodobacter daqingensis TaxID=1387281 RepID=A0ABW2UQA1_9RHOB